MMRSILLTCATGGVIAILLIWFFMTHHLEPKDVYVGYKGEARFNYLLAAQRFVENQGYEVSSEANLEPEQWMPPVADTVFLLTGRSNYTVAESGALLQWVNQGGHLFVSAGGQSDKNDPILSNLGVKTLTLESLSEWDEEKDGQTKEPSEEEDARLQIDTNYFQRLSSNNDEAYEYSDDDGVIALRQPYGNGLVTILADPSFLRNRNFSQDDHAFFFWKLAIEIGDPGNFLFIFGNERSSIWMILWERAPVSVMLIGLLVPLFLWHRGQRLGPLIAIPTEERRSLLEHIRAAGFFQWQHKSQATLIHSSRDAMLQEFGRWHPGVGRLNLEQQLELMTQHTSLDRATVKLALGMETNENFVNEINAIQTLRDHL